MIDTSISTYDLETSAVFQKTKDPYGGFSNMASGFEITIEDLTIRTSEALYQALKYPYLPLIVSVILDQRSPMSAKMVQKPYGNLVRRDWDDIRVDVMMYCVSLKAIQHREAYMQLIAESKGMPIVERSRKDDFWGAKLIVESNYDPTRKFGFNGITSRKLVGRNILGKIHMYFRDSIKAGTFNWNAPTGIRHIPNLVIMGKNIGDMINPN